MLASSSYVLILSVVVFKRLQQTINLPSVVRNLFDFHESLSSTFIKLIQTYVDYLHTLVSLTPVATAVIINRLLRSVQCLKFQSCD